MKESSKPFAWWFVEAFLGSQIVEPKPPSEPVPPEPKVRVVKREPEDDYSWLHG